MGITSWQHWLIVLVVVILVFGTKRLKNLGSDLGETVKGFRKAMNTEEDKPAEPQQAAPAANNEQLHKPQTIDAQAQKVEEPAHKD